MRQPQVYSAFLAAFLAAFLGAAFLGAAGAAEVAVDFLRLGRETPEVPIWIFPRFDLLSPFPIEKLIFVKV